MPSYLVGSALLLGALLVSAGTMKLVQPRPFTHAVHRLLPGRREVETTIALVAPAVVGTVEVVVGCALVAAPWLPLGLRDAAAGAAAALFLGFTLVVGYAIRRGVACGCWGSFSDGPAGWTELGRSLVLAGIAVSLAAVSFLAGPELRPWPAALVWTGVLAGLVVLGAYTGTRLAAATDAPTASGRPAGFLLGRVTSSRSGHGLPRVVRLRPGDAAVVAERARATPTGQALDAWLGSRGIDLDWRTLAVRRSSMRTVLGVQRYLLLVPPPESALTLTIAIRTNEPDKFEPVVSGDVDGCRLSIKRGEVNAREIGSG